MESSNNNHLGALLEMARALGSAYDLDQLLGMVVDYSMELLGAERATLFLYDDVTRELYTLIVKGTEGFRMSIDKGIAGAVARELEIINIPDAYDDERFNPEVDKKTGYRTRSILACPLKDYQGRLVGVLQVLNKRQGVFGDEDVALAEGFSAQAGVAIQRANLLEEQLEKQRMKDALKMASEIQQELFPKKSPQLTGFDIACWNRPCDEIGGDYCDFLRLDDKRLIVSLGDVTGHGVGPALVSCATRAMLRVLSSVNDNIEEVMQRVNGMLNADLPTGRFVTSFLGMVESDSGLLSYCSAGQGPLLWLKAATGEVESFGAGGIPMGILEDYGELPPSL